MKIFKKIKKGYLDKTKNHLDSDLIVWPETALPGYFHNEKEYIDSIKVLAKQSNIDILMGLIIIDFEKNSYTNSILSTADYRYDKRHLVPIGEYFPFRKIPEWLKKMLFFPVSDVSHGDEHQSIFYAAGQVIGPSICFEVAYANEIRKSLPQATLLISTSDDGFVSHTIEPYQRHQIARMRAIESARYLVRAVNSGFSTIIGLKRHVYARSKLHESTVITGSVQPLTGTTPYVYFSDVLLLCFVSVLLLLSWIWFPYKNK